MLEGSLLGSLFENMVVMDAVKQQLGRGKAPQLSFYRDAKGHEVDLILEKQRVPYPIEIKSAMTWHDHFAKGITWFQSAEPASGRGSVIYSGELEFDRESFSIRNFNSELSV